MAECEETGLGYRWEGAQLGSLHNYQPSEGHRCAACLCGLQAKVWTAAAEQCSRMQALVLDRPASEDKDTCSLCKARSASQWQQQILTVLQQGTVAACTSCALPRACRCEKFLMTVKHDPHMAGHYWLSDICQQRIDIVATKNGKTMFSQTSVVVAKDKFSDIGSCLCALFTLPVLLLPHIQGETTRLCLLVRCYSFTRGRGLLLCKLCLQQGLVLAR